MTDTTKQKILVAMLFMSIALSFVMVEIQPAKAPVQGTVKVQEDVYVSQANPNTNYGTTDMVITQGQSDVRRIYLQFNTTGMEWSAGMVVMLRMYCYVTTGQQEAPPASGVPSTTTIQLVTNNSWTETDLTWNDQPSDLSASNETSVFVDSTGWWQFNICGIASDGNAWRNPLSIVIFQATENYGGSPDRYNWYYSNEYALEGEWGAHLAWSGSAFSYLFYGCFDEVTGGDRTNVNVTAWYEADMTNQTETFEVTSATGQYYLTERAPQFFSFDLGHCTREYWLSESEQTTGVQNIYIFNTTDAVTLYTIAFLDLSGALDEYPFVEAQRYINGTLHTVEKRQSDEENKVYMNLVNGRTYTITISNSASFTYGDILFTSTTTVTLTLKGLEFPIETLLTYTDVYSHVTRAFDSPTGNITVTYQDTLLQTTSVEIFIDYRNGTNAYNATETADSFVHTWTSAVNTTDYQVTLNIDHTGYGTWSTRHFIAGSLGTSNPWSLDFLGTSLPFSSAYLIPIFAILFVGGCFSVLNVEVGAFMACVTAIIMVLLFALPIPISFIIVALTMAIGLGIIAGKRRVLT